MIAQIIIPSKDSQKSHHFEGGDTHLLFLHMSEFRELFDKASKKSSSINNNSEARALRLVRTNLLDKYSGNMNFSFNLEQIVVFVLTKVRGSLDQAFESFPQPELIIQKIIDINKKFFFELTPENITENEISILRYLSKKRTDLFPLLFILIIIKDYVYNDELEDCIKSLGIRCFNNLLMRN